MFRRFAVFAFLFACVLILTASLVTAAEDLLKLVPESASGFVVINHPAAIDAKLHAMGREMQLPVPKLMGLVKMKTGVNEGMDENGTFGLVLLSPKDEPHVVAVLLVPVMDYAKFLAQFDPEKADGEISKITLMGITCWARNIGGYAAITDTAHRELLENTLKLSAEIPASLAPWKDWLAANDVGGVIFKPGIQRVSTQVLGMLELAKMSMANAPENMRGMAGVFDVYGKMFQAAEKEVAACGIGLQLDKENVLRIASRTELTPGGDWAATLAKTSQDKENLLKGLPAGPFVIAGAGVVPSSVWDNVLKLSADIMKAMPGVYGIKEDQQKKMPEFSFDSMKAVRTMSMSMGVGKKGESLYSNFIMIMRVENSKEFMAAYEKDLLKYGEFVKAADTPMLTAMEIEKGEVSGIAALKFTVHAPKMPTEIPQQARMMEAMFGPGGKLEGWVVPADEHNIVTGYVSKERMKEMVEAVKKGETGLAADAAVLKTAAMLPKDAMSIGYLSPQGLINMIKSIASVVAPPEANVEQNIPEFPATPPVGFAMTAGTNELQTVLVVPPEVLKAIGQYVGKVTGRRMGEMVPAK